MFFRRRSAPAPLSAALIAVSALALPLAGCGDRLLDAGPVNYTFGGGPAPDAPSPIRAMSDDARPYPKLGTTPPRPTDVPTAQQTEAEMKKLAGARSANRKTADALRAIPGGPAPLAVPPPPKLTPGAPR